MFLCEYYEHDHGKSSLYPIFAPIRTSGVQNLKKSQNFRQISYPYKSFSAVLVSNLNSKNRPDPFKSKNISYLKKPDMKQNTGIQSDHRYQKCITKFQG